VFFQKADNTPYSSQLTDQTKWQLFQQEYDSQNEQPMNLKGSVAHVQCILLALALFILKPEFAMIHVYEGSLYAIKQAPGASSEPSIMQGI
jgi:hypothetical protein